jgi:D-alanyl-D-alanine carboxypeptidase (penicillin-binding protein 5/6)
MLVSLVVVLLIVAGLGSAIGVRRATRPLQQPSLDTVSQTSEPVPGVAAQLPWPPGGQAAVSIPSIGYTVQSGPEAPVPVASLTKMATAVVILRDHPITPGTGGPLVPVDADDAAQFGVDLANDETNIPLQPGEAITEVQLLQALLVASANDAAYTLAKWDAGSEAAFVAKMNGLDASLGARQTHFVDASGFLPQSVSTASDMLRIAAAGMSIPAFATLVDEPTATVPLAGPITNVVRAIGTNGIIGVKSGYTGQAGGCMVLAADRTVAGHSVLVLAAALGQWEPAPPPPPAPAPPPGAPAATSTTPATTAPPTTTTTTAPAKPYSAVEAEYPLLYAGPIVEGLLYVTETEVTPVTLTRPGGVVGTATVDWAGSRRSVPVVAAAGATLVGMPGQSIERVVTPATHPAGGAGSATVGSVRFTLGRESVVVPVVRSRNIPPPDWMWKLEHD